MARVLMRTLLPGLLAVGLAWPAAAALPGAGQPRQLRAAAPRDDDALRVAKRKRKSKSKKPEAAPAAPAPAPAPPPPPMEEEGGGGAISTTRRGPARVDFDDRLIQGQTNKSGAIYIFERKSSELHSMVRRRTTFREEILRSID